MLNFMQNLSTQGSLKTKQLLPNRFWIVEQNGIRVGTIQRQEDDSFLVTGTDSSIGQYSKSEIEQQFDIFKEVTPSDNDSDVKLEVYGYPTKHKPYNSVLDVKHKIPLYSKSQTSSNMYAAGYYLVHFPKGWVKGFCPKLSTLSANEFKGPFKTVMEQRQAFSNVNKD